MVGLSEVSWTSQQNDDSEDPFSPKKHDKKRQRSHTDFVQQKILVNMYPKRTTGR
jgi:hypothetical protein